MDPRMNQGEYNFGERDGSRQANLPGVYYHPQTNKFIETAGIKLSDGSVAYHHDSGKIQADAFTQIGYRPASEEELRDYRSAQKAADEAKRISASRTTTVMR